MPFTSPDWVPKLPFDPPDSIPISEFMLNEKHGRYSLEHSKPPFTCGLTGIEYSALEVRDRVEFLARSIAKELAWAPNEGTEWDKVVGVFSLNTIDTLTLAWAVHSLSGIVSPANAAYSATELEYQLKSSKVKALFTCLPLLRVAVEAASRCGIPKDRIYILDLPAEIGAHLSTHEHMTLNHLVQEGRELPGLEQLKWKEGQGARQTAFLCYSSGTSGLPKGVMISHRNVIANIMQIATYEKLTRDKKKAPGSLLGFTDIILGLLPQSHIYSLVVVCHVAPYRGDQVVILPRFEANQFLGAIQRFKIHVLYLVPPLLIFIAKNKPLVDKFDLSSVKSVFTGAAPLGRETADNIQEMYPHWRIRQGYGLTETSTVICSTAEEDIWFGSSGSLVPSAEVRIISSDGKEITGYDQPGELLIRSPSVVLGYLDNEAANKETFQNGWVKTGDEAIIRKSPKGNEHVWIVDRIKELIKYKGHQVAPAELEAHLLTHPAVADAAVIPVYDDAAGELPKAYVVKSPSVGMASSDQLIIQDIQRYVEQHKARHKWLRGGVEFIDVIPKSPSGKILRRLLKDKEREANRKRGPRL